ncbi:REST corepressor 2-like [Apodemus sylvaticus]|uniref:REST corepressor 2-like n=1 Tax=Apodemus sylvaticus TaxID=10129 RepID=UPI0022441240|nr:REST corepressor 2-like [Apodemus sylvaticus]
MGLKLSDHTITNHLHTGCSVCPLSSEDNRTACVEPSAQPQQSLALDSSLVPVATPEAKDYFLKAESGVLAFPILALGYLPQTIGHCDEMSSSKEIFLGTRSRFAWSASARDGPGRWRSGGGRARGRRMAADCAAAARGSALCAPASSSSSSSSRSSALAGASALWLAAASRPRSAPRPPPPPPPPPRRPRPPPARWPAQRPLLRRPSPGREEGGGEKEGERRERAGPR